MLPVVRRLFYIFITLLLSAGSVLAVLISGGNGAVNTTAPADDPGWSNVGSIRAGKPGMAGSRAGAVYLGDKWFITAEHVHDMDGPTGVVVGAVCYTVDSNSWTRLQNTQNPYKGTDTDLSLFQVKERPDLPSLRIRSTAVSSGNNVVMIGNGYDRHTDLVYWTANWELTNAVSGVHTGYLWNTSSKILRWGTNRVSAVNSWMNDGYGIIRAFRTTFDSTGGSNECQAALYDSGGGVFYKNSGNWELAGIMLVVDEMTNSAAVYGTTTYMADLSDFRVQITNTLVNFDSDIDGLPDWWETKYANNATNMSASVDSDNDGFTNEKEWLADTNPTNSASFFEIDSFAAEVDQTVTFIGSTARQYQVFYTTNDLTATNLTWITANTNKIWGAGTNSFITVTNTADKAFYRLKVNLP